MKVLLDHQKYEMVSVLRECEEYLYERADAEYFTDSPGGVPNEEMRLLVKIRDFLAMIGEDK